MSNPQTVAVIRTGAANLASVIAALERLGDLAPRVTDDPDMVRHAPLVVLPGVGAFGPAMSRLRGLGLDGPLRERIERGAPTLAICLGLQLLARSSEESPGVAGLGIVDVPVTRYGGSVRVPQMGWNRVEPEANFAFARSGYAYFANSYRMTECPEGFSAAWSSHAGRFIAAIRRGNVVACQFHPELSGAYGQELLRWWVGLVAQEPVPC